MPAITVLLSGVFVGVLYGVAFHYAYPLVGVDTGIAAVCAVAGLLTVFLIAGAFRLLRGKQT